MSLIPGKSPAQYIFEYSEWLDAQGLVVSDQTPDADTRTHEELVRDFLKESADV